MQHVVAREKKDHARSSTASWTLVPSLHSTTSTPNSRAKTLSAAVFPAPDGPERTSTRRYLASCLGRPWSEKASRSHDSTSVSLRGWRARSSCAPVDRAGQRAGYREEREREREVKERLTRSRGANLSTHMASGSPSSSPARSSSSPSSSPLTATFPLPFLSSAFLAGFFFSDGAGCGGGLDDGASTSSSSSAAGARGRWSAPSLAARAGRCTH